MKVKELNECLKVLLNENIEFTDIDVEKLYNTIFPKTFGSITFEEIDKILDFLKIDETNTEEEIRAKRNAVVKYWADDLKSSESKEEFEMRERVDNQMSAFTGAIDWFLHNHGWAV